MRIIVHGVGAVGGAIAANLALAGQEVAGIARGAQLAAIREKGLIRRAPDGTATAHFDCVASPDEIALRSDDMVLLAVKGQDTPGALEQWRAAGLAEQPLFCAQNGVENERLALRHFPNVHGITVMLPADFITPGEVAAFGAPRHGLFDIGRYPHGSDADDRRLAEVLGRCNFAAFVSDAVMDSKYGKLLMNLSNICNAALGRGRGAERFGAMLKAEGEAVLRAAGIAWQDVGLEDPRRTSLMTMQPVEGTPRTGSSTMQSLARGAGSVETGCLNGEIVLLGRLHGVATPVNSYFMALSARMLRDGTPPGSVDAASVAAELGL